MTTTIAKAPGKCILFGEHAVVHNYPALAVAINLFSECKISSHKYNKIILNLRDYEYCKEFESLDNMRKNINEKWVQIPIGLQYISEKYGIEEKRFRIRIEISSQIWPGSGLGSSASIAVALCSALSHYFNLGLDKANISHCALKCEQITHGNPSGIDNSICSYGGAILYHDSQIERVPIENFPILLIYSGEPHETIQAIRQVSNLIKKNPESTNIIFNEIGKITKRGLNALNSNNFSMLQQVLHQNQVQLQKLKLSTPNIDKILKIASNEEIQGIKITGAGSGGCLIAIDSSENLTKLSKKLKENSFTSILTSINYSGVQND
ncbi:mevalonate kinase [Candidatus Lokiarchaeum ossiferum]|uniref:mevalonate kinase n=1 Tax=Candidatus Lokiarchaeum ossiferum TaxID=2951803 RepID=UPI00352EBEA5